MQLRPPPLCREEQLLADLQQSATAAKQAIEEAAGLLNEGRTQTTAAKDQSVFPDAAARDTQQKNSEKQRQTFRDQQKRQAADAARQAEDGSKRAQQAVKNAENEVRNADKRVEQCNNSLTKIPPMQASSSNWLLSNSNDKHCRIN